MSAPRPDLLSALPGIIAARIRTKLPDLASCEGITGRFDLDTLKRYSVSAPAVLVSFLGAAQGASYAGPFYTFDVEFSAFVVTKSQLGLPRDIACANICAALLRLIPDARWGEAGIDGARDLRVIPILTATINPDGVSLWSVVWKQGVTLQDIDPGRPLPLELYVRAAQWGEQVEQIKMGGAP